MDGILEIFGVHKISVILAGAVGGTVSLRHYTDASFKTRCWIIAGSIALANYLTVPFMSYFGAEARNFELGIAAGIGMFGLSLVSSLTSVIRDTDYWKKFLRGIFNKDTTQ